MNKIIILALITLTLGITQAEYTLKYPLEQSQGGPLPSGSITLKNNLPTNSNTYSCSINEYSALAGWISFNADCSDGVLSFKIGFATTTGTCSNGNYSYKRGLGTISGVCNTPLPTE